jgi:hypothetical protein
MIENVPIWLNLFFELVVAVTIVWLFWAGRSRPMLFFLIAWTSLQAFLGLRGIFLDTTSTPPNLMVLGVAPALAFILALFFSPRGRRFMDGLDLKTLTYFHMIRVPVEVILVLLLHQGLVAKQMTLEGTNFDLFSGITAPVVAILAFKAGKVNKTLLLGWNAVCLALLLNVVITAIFALPTSFQMLAFDQPNTAVLYFPYHLLPTVVVPAVLFAHLVAIRRLIGMGKK